MTVSLYKEFFTFFYWEYVFEREMDKVADMLLVNVGQSTVFVCPQQYTAILNKKYQKLDDYKSKKTSPLH